MMNLIRMNLIRTLKNKCAGILFLVTLFISSFIALDSTNMASAEAEQMLLEEQGVSVDATLSEDGSPVENVGISVMPSGETDMDILFGEFITSGVLLIMISIFTAIYVCKERDTGFLKNLSSCNSTQKNIFLAKSISVVIVCMQQLLAVFLGCLIFGTKHVTSPQHFLLFILVQFLMHAAFGIFLMAVLQIFRSLASGLLIGIFVSMGVLSLVLSYLEMLLAKLGVPDFLLLNQYTLVSMTKSIAPDSTIMVLLSVGVTALIEFLLYLTVGTLLFRKKDLY